MDYGDHIREHMEVVGSDGQHVGTVDHLEDGRLKLTKSDPNSGGEHHFLDLASIDHVEADKVCLNIPGDEAMLTWQA